MRRKKSSHSLATAFITIFGALLGALFLTPNANAAPISLEEAYRAALTKTESTSIAQSRLKQSSSREDQARGRFLPTLSAGASWQRQDRTLGPEAHTDEVATKLTLSQSIFAGGQDSARLDARKQESVSFERRLSSTRQAVFAEVARAYYAVLSSESEEKNVQKTISLAQERISEMQKRTAIGRSKTSDLLAARAQLAVLQSQFVAAQGQRSVARDRFAFVSGLERNVALVTPSTEVPQGEDLDKHLTTIDQHPDIEELRAKIEQSKHEVRSFEAGHYPSIDLNSNYYMSRTGSPRENQWDLTVGLTFPIYSGGVVQAQVREAKEKEVEAELLLRQKRRELESLVRTSYGTLSSSLDQVKSLQQALLITEQNYLEQVKEYRYSRETNIDVIQALNSLQDTKRTLDRTRYQAWTAWAELKALTSRAPL